MIKASKSICLIFLALAATVSTLRAQTTPADAVDKAADEALHRQADTITLRKTLLAAQAARQRRDLVLADKLYGRCYVLVQNIGSGIDIETQQTISGLTSVLLELAHQSQQHHDYKLADEQFNRILVVDPKNPAALQGKRENHELLEAQAGTIPSPEVMAQIPTYRTNEIRIQTMVQDGKAYFEAGKLDLAEEKLKQAYAEDPSNVAAYSYLTAIRQKRMAIAGRDSDDASNDHLVEVEKAWTHDVHAGPLVARPNAFARSNQIHTSPGRQAIIDKLNSIHVDVKYDGLPLSEVINDLSEKAKARDPDRLGLNFFIDREAPPAATGAAGAIDPATGLPVAPLPTEQADVSAVTVKIALNGIRLADALDAITKTSDKPIKFSVLDYAVVFSLRGAEATPLETRTFHVDPDTFKQGLQSVEGIPFANVTTSSGSSGGGSSSGGSSGGSGGSSGSTSAVLPQVNVTGGSTGGTTGGGGGGGGGTGGGILYVTSRTNTTLDLQIQVRQFFSAVGVDLNTNNPANAGKMFVWNDRKGVLLVHATSQDLDMIAAAIDALNQAPPEINIKAKFIEITQNDNRGLGFKWSLGNISVGGVAGSGGTQPSFQSGQSTLSDPIFGAFPGSVSGGTTIAPSQTDGSITGGLRNIVGTSGTLPTIGTITGIFTDPQFRVAINALQQRDGVDELNAPEVTTTSGRQAQIQAVDVQTIVTGQNIGSSGSSPSVSGVANGLSSPIVQTPIANNYTTQPLPFGPVLDVIPYLSADEYSIQMTLIPSVTEFVGYDDPGQFVPAALVSGQTGNASLTAVLPLPHFRLRQVTTSVIVWDAQTVVMGGLLTDTVTRIKDKVPMLGDMPLVGRLFQSESSSKSKKNLMIFVTPTIINGDGTRFHSDEEMPFAQSGSVGAKTTITP